MAATLDNDTDVDLSKDKPDVVGTPTEAALLIAAQKGGIDTHALWLQTPRIFELTFDSERKRMSTVHHTHNGNKIVSYTKGSLDDVISQCSRIFIDDNTMLPLTSQDIAEINEVNERYAQQGLRSLALAMKVQDAIPQEGFTIANTESDLVFIGLMAMDDPPRPEIYDAVRECHSAGIRIIMVTGDSALTAKSIETQIGLVSDAARVITGTELDAMTDDDLRQALHNEVIFARVAPEHKYRIVSTLQKNGEIVASTGDGVNDAPALKQADISIAMGVTGTDVAKEAADIILLDDNFTSIVAAVREGRAVYSNIQKFLTYILTSNVPEAMPSILFLFSRGLIPLPMTIMQILAVDLGTDMLPALGLGAEPAEVGIMEQPPRAHNAHLLSKRILLRAFAWYGILESLVAVGAYFFVNLQNGWPTASLASSGTVYARATTLVLGAIIFAQIANALNCRTQHKPILASGEPNLRGNHAVWIGIASELVLFVFLTFTPGIQSVFNTAVLTWQDWIYLIAIPIPLFLIEEARKAIILRLTSNRENSDRKNSNNRKQQ